jgi:sterol desaturase/sphingolipid hydroxylase (fatty acid hydroxylase superfamily)
MRGRSHQCFCCQLPMSSVSGTLIATAVAAPAVAILQRLEKTRPIEPEQPRGAILMDYWIVALNVVAGLCLTSIVGGYAAESIRAVGGGFVALRSDGWWFVVSLSVVILAGDFFAYLVHRAQHAIPATGLRYQPAGIVDAALWPLRPHVDKGIQE